MKGKSKFGFTEPSDEKKIVKKKNQKTPKEKALDRAQAATEKARIALHSKPFKALLKEYKGAERQIIDRLITLSIEQFDSELFANESRSLLSKISNIRVMIENVYKKAGEKYGQ